MPTQNDLEEQDRRVEAVLGRELEEMDFDEGVSVFHEHLKRNLKLPFLVKGREDFRWEEPYVLGAWDQQEYKQLKKTQPSYKDTFEFLELLREAESEWVMYFDEDLGARVRRVSDGREFVLGVAELEAVERKSPNYQLLNDYAYWFVNNR